MNSAKRIPALDGVRGVAIALVLIWHYLVQPVQLEPGTLASYAIAGLGLTWSGVDLFFVLSGFLIGGILIDNRGSTYFFRTFYWRRACRIFPLYYSVVAVFSVLLILLDRSTEAWSWLLEGPMPLGAYATFTQNFGMATRGEFGARILAVTWSLAIEEQFYLLFPLLIRYCPTKRLMGVLIGMILIAPVVRLLLYFESDSLLAHRVLLVSRWDSLLCGVLVAVILRSRVGNVHTGKGLRYLWSAFAISGLGLGILVATRQTEQSVAIASFGYTWISFFYSTLIMIVVVYSEHRFTRPLRWNSLRWLGEISFGVYLLHLSVNGIAHALILGRPPLIDGFAAAGVTLFALLVTFSACTISWKYFEQPIVRVGHRAQF